MDYYDLYDITPEQEAILEAQVAKQEVDDWLAGAGGRALSAYG